ncbi:MAG TPA: hypothetical protein VMT54_00910 [Candidatus Cybelea sp.]|nr:hypothetical protein [Candidatus Cybelea sp.]
MTETSKPTEAKRRTSPEKPKTAKGEITLEEKELDAATGGTSLMNACATGKHIDKASITG